MDCEDKTVVLERPKDLCFLSEADVGLPVDVLADPRAFCSVCDVSELGFNDPATLEGYEGQLMRVTRVN